MYVLPKGVWMDLPGMRDEEGGKAEIARSCRGLGLVQDEGR